jgi:hypothetical protein
MKRRDQSVNCFCACRQIRWLPSDYMKLFAINKAKSSGMPKLVQLLSQLAYLEGLQWLLRFSGGQRGGRNISNYVVWCIYYKFQMSLGTQQKEAGASKSARVDCHQHFALLLHYSTIRPFDTPPHHWIGQAQPAEAARLKKVSTAQQPLVALSQQEAIMEWEGHVPSTTLSINQLTRILSKSKKADLRSYLVSIAADATFVAKIRSYLTLHFRALPCFGNLRAGGWYSPSWDGECRFTSCDGHSGQWKFNPIRTNLNVLRSAAAEGGCIIVDSTRKGKRFPDSFTATVPIWCTVMNLLALEGGGLRDHIENAKIFMHPPWLSASESSQISELLPMFINEIYPGLRQSLAADAAALLSAPLAPIWVHPGTCLDTLQSELRDCTSIPIICVVASAVEERDVPEVLEVEDLWSEMQKMGASLPKARSTPVCVRGGDWTYIQGAGDDEEFWSRGLTRRQFWQNAQLLLSLRDSSELSSAVNDIIRTASLAPWKLYDESIWSVGTTLLSVATLSYLETAPWDGAAVCLDTTTKRSAGSSDDAFATLQCPLPVTGKNIQILRLPAPSLKRCDFLLWLSVTLPRALVFIFKQSCQGSMCTIACANGTTHSSIVAAAALIAFAGQGGNIRMTHVTKTDIRTVVAKLHAWLPLMGGTWQRAHEKLLHRFFVESGGGWEACQAQLLQLTPEGTCPCSTDL